MPRHPLPTLICGIAIGYFALWACAPPTMLPPPLPAAPGEMRIGGAIGPSGQIYRSESCPRCPPSQLYVDPGGAAQAWFMRRFGQRFDVGWSLYGAYWHEWAGGGGGSGFVRFGLVETDRLYVGAQADLGWLYARAGVPIAARVAEGVWVTTGPALVAGMLGPLQVPLGLSFEIGDRCVASTELSVHPYLLDLGYIGYTTTTLSLGATWRLGKK